MCYYSTKPNNTMDDTNEVTEITSQIARLLGKRGGEKVKQKGKEYEE